MTGVQTCALPILGISQGRILPGIVALDKTGLNHREVYNSKSGDVASLAEFYCSLIIRASHSIVKLHL